ncbi:hypothetical protein LX36DRAFT_658631, partial [Colletotrichum falcatum]
IDTSTFNPYLLISSANNDNFALIGIQTDDTIRLTNKPFSKRKNVKLEKATFTAKPNSVLSLHANSEITLYQKGQGKRLQPVNAESPQAKQQYIKQRAHGAYIASFTVNSNIIHFSSTKYKRVTRSVLTSKIYAIVAGYLQIPTVIYTNLYSLYKCLVKLSTIKEKHLIINIIALQ